MYVWHPDTGLLSLYSVLLRHYSCHGWLGAGRSHPLVPDHAATLYRLSRGNVTHNTCDFPNFSNLSGRPPVWILTRLYVGVWRPGHTTRWVIASRRLSVHRPVGQAQRRHTRSARLLLWTRTSTSNFQICHQAKPFAIHDTPVVDDLPDTWRRLWGIYPASCRLHTGSNCWARPAHTASPRLLSVLV